MEQKAERDSLTDLYNKAKMHKLVEKHIQQADDTEGAFLIIDIDDFKTINDTCGHLYGDEVLIKIANTILISAGMEDYAGRIGGDEFCVFCRGKMWDSMLWRRQREYPVWRIRSSCQADE